MLYAEGYTQYTETPGVISEYTLVTTPADNLWILTENDNFLVSETGDYLVIY